MPQKSNIFASRGGKAQNSIKPSKRDEDDEAEVEADAAEDEETGDQQKSQPTFNIDAREANTFLDFFNGMESPQANTIRFFYRKKDGDYYTCHGSDALFIAQECFHTMSVIKYIGKGNDFPSVAVSVPNFNNFVTRLLTEKNHRVEVWGESRSSGSSKGSWALIKQGSPGNLESFEDTIFEASGDIRDTPTAVSVQIVNDAAGWRVGIAFCDNTVKTIGLCEFIDCDQLSGLESALVRLGAKECILAEDKLRSPVEGSKLRDLMERCEVVLTERKSKDFGIRDVEQDLARLIGSDSSTKLDMAHLENKNALAAAACLIKYLDLLGDASLFGKFRLSPFSLDQHMRLDSAAMRALNLLPQPTDANRNMSLYGLLNKCKTAIGSRLLLRWIKQPLLDRDEIEARLDLVETLFDDVQLRQSLQEVYLRHVPDLSLLARKLQRKSKATLMDAWRLYQFVLQIPSMRQALEDATGDHSELVLRRLVEPLRELEKDFKPYEQLVEQSLDLEGIDQHEYRINPRYNEELRQLADERDEVKADIERERAQAARRLGLADDKVKLEKSAKDKVYALRVTRKDEKVLRAKSGTFTVLETRKDGVKFTCKELRPLADRHRDIDVQYDEIQATLVAKVVEIISTYAPAVESLAALVAELDVLVSLAHISANAPTPYVRPVLGPAGEGDLVLKDARHPCVEVMEDVSFIANDVELRREAGRVQIVTGPNMGGKSTYIRQAGVIVLMAQVGCFVPCSEAEVPVTHAIYARIGASDNPLRGISTFMSEMLETASILRGADRRSLVIVDELGRGTSTYDGFGLAWAIAEHLAREVRAPCLFATHFHELTDLAAAAAPLVANRHVTAHIQDGRLTMLYKVREGPCDQSFGIHVAEMAKFPPHVVDMAKRKAAELESFACEPPAGGATPAGRKRARGGEDGAGAEEEEEEEEVGEEARREGTKIMSNFLRDFAELPLGQLAPEEGLARVRALREAAEAAGNPYVRRVLARQLQAS